MMDECILGDGDPQPRPEHTDAIVVVFEVPQTVTLVQLPYQIPGGLGEPHREKATLSTGNRTLNCLEAYSCAASSMSHSLEYTMSIAASFPMALVTAPN